MFCHLKTLLSSDNATQGIAVYFSYMISFQYKIHFDAFQRVFLCLK